MTKKPDAEAGTDINGALLRSLIARQGAHAIRARPRLLATRLALTIRWHKYRSKKRVVEQEYGKRIANDNLKTRLQ